MNGQYQGNEKQWKELNKPNRKLSVSRTGKIIFIEKEGFLCPHGLHMTRAKEWIDQSIVLMITIIKIRYSNARTMFVVKL